MRVCMRKHIDEDDKDSRRNNMEKLIDVGRQYFNAHEASSGAYRIAESKNLADQSIDSGLTTDEKILHEISQYPALYYSKHHLYGNTNHKEEIWKYIAAKLNIEGGVKYCKCIWATFKNQCWENRSKILKKIDLINTIPLNGNTKICNSNGRGFLHSDRSVKETIPQLNGCPTMDIISPRDIHPNNVLFGNPAKHKEFVGFQPFRMFLDDKSEYCRNPRNGLSQVPIELKRMKNESYDQEMKPLDMRRVSSRDSPSSSSSYSSQMANCSSSPSTSPPIKEH